MFAAPAYLARCIGLAAEDKGLTEAKRRELEDAYAHAAVEALRRVFEKRREDPKILESPYFDPLKGRPEFEKLKDAVKSRGQNATV